MVDCLEIKGNLVIKGASMSAILGVTFALVWLLFYRMGQLQKRVDMLEYREKLNDTRGNDT